VKLWPQVSNPDRPDIVPHLANVLAQRSHHGTDQESIADGGGVAHVTPLLAFNLGLEYELAPFLGSDKAKSLPSGSPPSLPLESSPVGCVMIQKLAGCSATGAHGAADGTEVARAVSLAKIRRPSCSVYGVRREAPKELDSTAGERELQEEVETEQDQEPEAILAIRDALQRHFQDKPRSAIRSCLGVLLSACMSATAVGTESSTVAHTQVDGTRRRVGSHSGRCIWQRCHCRSLVNANVHIVAADFTACSLLQGQANVAGLLGC
jgi:hypothetical protein